VGLLRYIDVVLLVAAAPVLLLIGVPAVGYLTGAGVWIVLRVVGVGIDRYAAAAGNQASELTLRLTYLIGRLMLLALAVIFVRQDAGRDAGLTALAVVVFAFTVQLAVSIATRPRSR